MRVNIVGFEWHLPESVPLEDLMTFLQERQGNEHKFDGLPRIWYVDEFEHDFWAGILISIKDHKNFCKLRSDAGGPRVTVGKVEDGHRLMEFNLFGISKRTNRGLFMTYRGSCGLTAFHLLVQQQYREFREEAIKRVMEEENKRRAAVAGRFPMRMRWNPLARKEGFEKLVAALTRVRGFEFEVATASVEQPRFLPVLNMAKTQKRKVTFKAGLEPQMIANKLMDFIRQEGIKKATAHGDLGDLHKTYQLLDNPDIFWDQDFDELTNELNFEAKDYSKSDLLEHVFDAADAHPDLF